MVKEFGKKELEIVINMKDITKMIKNGDMENSHGLVVISTKGIMKEMCAAAMEKCFGQMEAIIKENGSMASSMVKVKCILYRLDLCT